MPTSIGAVFDALQNFVAEIAINADVHQRKAPLKFRKNIGKKIQAGGFVGAKNHRALHHVAAVRHALDRIRRAAAEAVPRIRTELRPRA